MFSYPSFQLCEWMCIQTILCGCSWVNWAFNSSHFRLRYCRAETKNFCFALSKLLNQGIYECIKRVVVKFGVLFYAAILAGHPLSDLGEIFLCKKCVENIIFDYLFRSINKHTWTHNFPDLKFWRPCHHLGLLIQSFNFLQP